MDDSYYSRFYSIMKHYLNYDFAYAHLAAKQSNDDVDKQSLALFLERRRWETPLVEFLSFSLLPNHFHFQIKQLVDNGLSKFMHRLGTSYTNYFNTRLERVGRLFQGPFKSVRVESEGQFLCLNRYIHVNPIAAGLVNRKNLAGWSWSSLPEYLGRRKNGAMCETKEVLSYFKDKDDYLDFILADFKESERQELEGLAVDDDFDWFEDVAEQRRQMRRELMDSFQRG